MESFQLNIEFHDAADKLKKSLYHKQTERLKLEQQLNDLLKSNKQFVRLKATALHRKWQQFLEQDRSSKARNERILQNLSRIEVQAEVLASRSKQLKVLKEKYERQLNKTVPGWNDEISIDPLKNTILPVHQSTPLKSVKQHESHHQGQAVDPLSYYGFQSMEFKKDEPSEAPVAPPRARKKSRNLSFGKSDSKSSESGLTTPETSPQKLTLRSSAIIKSKAKLDLVPDKNVTENVPALNVVEPQTENIDNIALKDDEIVNKVNDNEFCDLKSEDQVTSEPMKTDDLSLSNLSNVSSQSSSIHSNSTSEITPPPVAENVDGAIKKMETPKPKISEELQSSSAVELSNKIEDLDLDSSDDDFFQQKAPPSDTYNSLLQRSSLKTSSLLEEVDNEIEDELAAALSGHSPANERKQRPLNLPSQKEELTSEILSEDREDVKNDMDAPRIQVKSGGSSSKAAKKPKWSLGVNSDSEDVSFGSNASIPGIDSDQKDDFDFYD